MSKIIIKIRQSFVLFVIITGSFVAYAQGDLVIFPKRVVFDGENDRVKKVHVTNNGNEMATYRISYIELEMNLEGKLVELDTSNHKQNLASPNLRLFPRKVTLMPGESQVVKIQLVGVRGLAEGEYRSHLYFRSVPLTKLTDDILPENNFTDDISIRLNYVYGVSIANIIRVGEPNAKVSINSMKLLEVKEQKILIDMSFERKGTTSTYGSIDFEYISPKGKVIPLQTIKGLAIYTPGNLRNAIISLNLVKGVDFTTGSLKAIYREEGSKSIYGYTTIAL